MMRPDAQAALAELVARDDPSMVGLVLTGSAARGMATDRSDVDVYVVRENTAGHAVRRGSAIDEIPISLAELERPGPFGSVDWWQRWSFAWAQVLRDDPGGRVAAGVRAQATLTEAEQRWILTRGDRLDGWLNFAYRALKSARDGRPLESRLDAAESVPWLLDVVFTLHGRVRPYNKYLPWELRKHPLPDWPADLLLPLVERLLAGDPAASRDAFALVEPACRRYDAATGRTELGDLIEDWGDELAVLRG